MPRYWRAIDSSKRCQETETLISNTEPVCFLTKFGVVGKFPNHPNNICGYEHMSWKASLKNITHSQPGEDLSVC